MLIPLLWLAGGVGASFFLSQKLKGVTDVTGVAKGLLVGSPYFVGSYIGVMVSKQLPEKAKIYGNLTAAGLAAIGLAHTAKELVSSGEPGVAAPIVTGRIPESQAAGSVTIDKFIDPAYNEFISALYTPINVQVTNLTNRQISLYYLIQLRETKTTKVASIGPVQKTIPTGTTQIGERVSIINNLPDLSSSVFIPAQVVVTFSIFEDSGLTKLIQSAAQINPVSMTGW